MSRDKQRAAAFVALCAGYDEDEQPVLDFMDGLSATDLQVLAVVLGRWFASERARTLRLEHQMRLCTELDEGDARRLVIEDARCVAVGVAAGE